MNLIEKDIKGYKYYSFYIGGQGSRNPDWLLFDLKWLAIDVYEAITNHYFHLTYMLFNNLNWIARDRRSYKIPTRHIVRSHYRQILEFQKIHINKGLTEHRYKKI